MFRTVKLDKWLGTSALYADLYKLVGFEGEGGILRVLKFSLQAPYGTLPFPTPPPLTRHMHSPQDNLPTRHPTDKPPYLQPQ